MDGTRNNSGRKKTTERMNEYHVKKEREKDVRRRGKKQHTGRDMNLPISKGQITDNFDNNRDFSAVCVLILVSSVARMGGICHCHKQMMVLMAPRAQIMERTEGWGASDSCCSNGRQGGQSSAERGGGGID